MLNREIMQAVALPEVKERLTASGIEAVGSTQEEFTARIKAEIDIWRGSPSMRIGPAARRGEEAPAFC
jgi:tripartite-type tricarboxylate transporter receptor subunit TctC